MQYHRRRWSWNCKAIGRQTRCRPAWRYRTNSMQTKEEKMETKNKSTNCEKKEKTQMHRWRRTRNNNTSREKKGFISRAVAINQLDVVCHRVNLASNAIILIQKDAQRAKLICFHFSRTNKEGCRAFVLLLLLCVCVPAIQWNGVQIKTRKKVRNIATAQNTSPARGMVVWKRPRTPYLSLQNEANKTHTQKEKTNAK